MLINSYAISPQQYCYYLIYSSYTPSIFSTYIIQTEKLNKEQHSNQSLFFSEYEKIMLQREDLLEQGYKTSKRAWTQQEDRLLLQLCKDENARFEQIAQKIQGRNSKMCYSRYRRLVYQSKVSWSKQEDQKIITLVEEYGENKWNHISTFFKQRTHKQLKDHYENYLKIDLDRSEWSLDEDLQLIRLLNIYGKNWREIEKAFSHRGKNQIKNRYFGRITRLNKKKLNLMRMQKENYEGSKIDFK